MLIDKVFLGLLLMGLLLLSWERLLLLKLWMLLRLLLLMLLPLLPLLLIRNIWWVAARRWRSRN
jgi:hypothetical protein